MDGSPVICRIRALYYVQPTTVRAPRTCVRSGNIHTVQLPRVDMMSLKDGTRNAKRLTRREALSKLAAGSVLLAAFTALLVFLRVPVPSMLRERTLARLGTPDRFPFNAYTFVAEKNIFVYRTREGFKAVSALCPHLGCVITQLGGGFRCPCHGSTFGANGEVLGGPAPKPLTWLKVGLSPDGQITVDTSERVPEHQLLKI